MQQYRAKYDMKLVKDAAEAMVNKDSKAWAQEHCIGEHVCLSREFREKMKSMNAHSDLDEVE